VAFDGLQKAGHPVVAWVRIASSLPFDAIRAHHAAWVQAGWIEPSIIASGQLERMLGSFEKLSLGPWARRVGVAAREEPTDPAAVITACE
jgi:hypothetical protein